MGAFTVGWGRVAALAVATGLTVAFVAAVGIQVMAPAPASRDEEAARIVDRDRLVRAADQAWAEGDEQLAEWIESLPMFPGDEAVAALP
jgi:hypothetical protein